MKELSRYESLAIFLVRLAFGYRLIWGTWDNIISYDRMLEFRDFLEVNGFPLPLVSAFISVYIQFLAGLSWVVGFQTRIMSTLMIVNFAVALLFVHLGDTYIGAAPAIHMFTISIFILVRGPGKYNLEARFARHF